MEPLRLDARNFPNAPDSLLGADIVEAAVGRHHTVLITADGEAYSAGWNSMGQVCCSKKPGYISYSLTLAT
jgi:alpha-tubulin suppressor-like RCC1 family protein